MYFKVVLALITAFIAKQIFAYSYCGPENADICSESREPQNYHIACDKDFPPQSTAKLNFMYPMTRKLKKFVLNIHNTYRNRIASGEEVNALKNDKYPTATDMREMLWDNELAYLAHVHAKNCLFQHDRCRATKRFKNSGQNISNNRKSGYYYNVTAEDVITIGMKQFWDEKDEMDETMSVGSSGKKPRECGHFTVVIGHQNSFVGCAVASCNGSVVKGGTGMDQNFQFTCNYEMTNLWSANTYQVGPIASNCSRWNSVRSTRYKNLCVNTGKIFKFAWESGL